MPKELITNTFDDHIQENCVVDFYTSECPSCAKFAPVFEELSQECDAYKFYKVNLDDDISLAERFSIDAIPTIIRFQNGVPTKTNIGYMNTTDFGTFLESEGDV